MIWSLCLLLAFQPAAAKTPAGQPTAPAQEPETKPAPVYDVGPLRAEVTAMYDARYWYADAPPGARKSELRMQLRIVGEGITRMARVGNVIFTEAVDDTGKALVGPDTYTEQQKTETRPFHFPAERIRSSGILLGARVDSPNRDARTVKLRGSVRLILASDPEEITIDNPLQFMGKILENDRLKELGVQVRVVDPAELEGESLPPAERLFVLEYLTDEAHIAKVTLHDAWMKPIRARQRRLKTKDGKSVVGFTLSGGTIDENCQLVLSVYPKIEDKQVPIEVDALKLP